MPDDTSHRGPWWAAPGPLDPSANRLCAICGKTPGFDTEDGPDTATRPICGDCSRARDFDQMLWEQDLAEPDAGLW